MKNLDLFKNIGKKRRLITFKNLSFEVYVDKEDEALLDEVLDMLENKFKEEEERIARIDPDVDWATVLVNVAIDIAYRYAVLKGEADRLKEAVKFNLHRIDNFLGNK
ncbi:MAG: cell division protein ZapA [Candidatus Hydrothermia bacterium]